MSTVSIKTSKRMSSIRSKNTKIEIKLRKALWKRGHRYRIHKKLPGSPDIVFAGNRTAIFVDGDFWHGYQFEKLRPKLKNDFWLHKIKRNMQRDREVNKELRKSGWKIMRIWEHDINSDLNKCIKKIERRMSNVKH